VTPRREAARRAAGRRTAPVEAEPAAERPDFRDRETWISLGIVVAILAAVVAAGVGASAAVQPYLTGPTANCHPSRQLAPRTYAAPPPMCIDVKRNYTATITTTKGKIAVLMTPSQAPQTVNNFVVLAANNYYNGLRFWRIEDWVVQTGDPRDTGRGGPGYNLPEERNTQQWAPGSVGMARPVGGPVNGSQFFITKGTWPGGGPGDIVYNRFGTVVLGFDILSQLTADDRVLGITIQSG
jgi:cyclophilin family peptidyl-prolyl cis-trans isomerase